MEHQNNLTAEYLRSILDYDLNTGIFKWKKRTSNRVHIGQIAGRTNRYIEISINYQRYLAHRLAWLTMTGKWPKEEIDHINEDKTDNRWCNLREATKSQNGANRKLSKRNTSGYKGISWDKRYNKWRVNIVVKKEAIQLGYFNTSEEAAFAYNIAAKYYFNVYAKLNNIINLENKKDIRKQILERIKLRKQKNGLPVTNKTGYLGVCWYKQAKKFLAQITIKGQKMRLGYFDDPIEAAKIWDTVAIKYRGQNTKLNFPHLLEKYSLKTENPDL